MAMITIKTDAEAFFNFLGGRRKRKLVTVTQQAPTGSMLRAFNLPIIQVAQTCHQQIVRDIMSKPPEVGGWLLGPTGSPVVTHFVLDSTGRGTAASFTFDHTRLNDILRQYVALGLDAKGAIHSHPSGYTRLSSGDLTYVKKLFNNPKNDVHEIYMPIVVDRNIHPYIVYRDNPDEPQPAQLVLI